MSGGVVLGGICLSGLRNRRDLRIGQPDIGVRLKEHFDDAETVIRRRFDVFDVVDRRRQRALRLCGDAAGHVGRLQACVLPNDRNDRNAYVRKDIDRRAKSRQRPDDENNSASTTNV